jgi:Protein of unknown function (DUF2937)
MAKLAPLAGGLVGAALLMQFPEFSQQYIQRLGGKVDELHQQVDGCKEDAASVGLTCEQALEQMQGTDFLNARRQATLDAVSRLDSQERHLLILQNSSPIERLLQLYRFTDIETLQGTWDAYRPALPMTADGFAALAIGFGIGAVLASVVVAVLSPGLLVAGTVLTLSTVAAASVFS